MAGNGGIIGPVNTVTAGATLSAKTTAFIATGTFAVQCAACGGTRTGSVLVVAGGGSGGSQGSGGGGAGGLRLLSCQTLPTSPVAVTIGAGGVGSGPTPISPVESPGRQGCASVFAATPNPITSAGGGAGVHQLTNVCAGEGGSGGGGTGNSPDPEILANGNEPPESPSQGNPGGTGNQVILGCNGGGGGGAGGAGTNASAPGAAAGGGGPGFDVTPVFGASPQPFYNPFNGIYAGGGGGAYDSRNASTPGAGGPGGGTAGVGPGTSGAAAVNSGSGSGGGNYGPGGSGNSGNGGSGVVLVKEDATTLASTAPGIWSMNTVYDFVKNGNWV